LRKTRPTFAKVTAGNSTSTLPVSASEVELYRFSVTAASNGDVDLGQLAFQFTHSGLASLNDVTVVDASDPNTVLGQTITGIASGNIIYVDLAYGAPDSGVVVGAGTTKTFIVKSTVQSGGVGTASLTTKLISNDSGVVETNNYAGVAAGNGVVWSDYADPSHTKGGGSLDFTNGLYMTEIAGTSGLGETTYQQTY
jgi:hypothetical protein